MVKAFCSSLKDLDGRDNVLKLLDIKVESEVVQNDMIKVLKIAVLCTRKLPSLRPSMREVVKMLLDADPYSSSTSNILDEITPTVENMEEIILRMRNGIRCCFSTIHPPTTSHGAQLSMQQEIL